MRVRLSVGVLIALTALIGSIWMIVYQVTHPSWEMTETTGTVIGASDGVSRQTGDAVTVLQVEFTHRDGYPLTVRDLAPQQNRLTDVELDFQKGDEVVVHYVPWNAVSSARLGPVPETWFAFVVLQIGIIVVFVALALVCGWFAQAQFREDQQLYQPMKFRYDNEK